MCIRDRLSKIADFPDTLYYIGNAATALDVSTSFEQSDEGCPLTYALTQDGWNGPGSFDANLLSFDSTTGVVTVFTSDVATYEKSTRTLKVTVTSTESLTAPNNVAEDVFVL